LILAPVKLAKSVAFFNAFTFRFCSLNNSFFRIFRVALLFICQGSFLLSFTAHISLATAFIGYHTLSFSVKYFFQFFCFLITVRYFSRVRSALNCAFRESMIQE